MDALNAILGLEVDYETGSFRRSADASGLNAGTDFDAFPMYGGRKRCKVNGEGCIQSFYGSDAYAEDEENEMMVYQPKFYYRVEPIKLEEQKNGMGYHLRRAAYYVSAHPHAGFRLHPAFYDEAGNEIDYILLSAYEACYFDGSENAFFNDNAHSSKELDFTEDSVHSRAGYKPISGCFKPLTRPAYEKLARNLGNGWHGDTIKSLSAQQFLMMIEFGSMNLQKTFAIGVTNFTSSGTRNNAAFTGATTGNESGMAECTAIDIEGATSIWKGNGFTSFSYRGAENLYGDLFTFVDGITIWGDGTLNGGVPYVAMDYNFREQCREGNYRSAGFTLAEKCGFWTATGWCDDAFDWLLLASETKEESDCTVGDYQYVTPNLDGYRLIRMGGDWHYEDKTGLFTMQCHLKSKFTPETFTSRGVGGRLIHVPEAQSVVYKSNIRLWKES